MNLKRTLFLTIGIMLMIDASIVAVAQATNSLPGTLPDGSVDVVALINLANMVITPVLLQLFKANVLSKLDSFPTWKPVILNLLAPCLGALIGLAFKKLGISATVGWGAALYGAAGTWVYELAANAKDATAKK